MNQTLSARQTGVIASLLLLANKLLVLPSLLFESSKADGVFIVMFLLALELGLVALFVKLKQTCPNQSLYQIIQEKMGTFFAKLFYILLILYFFYKIMLIFNISYMYFHVQVYLDASYYIFIFIFLLIMNSCCLRGLRPLARGCEFMYIFLIGALVFCLFLSIANFNKFPLFFDSPIKNFFTGSFKYFFCFGDSLVLFVLMDRITLDKATKKSLFCHFAISSVIITVLYFMFYSAFGSTSFMYKNAVSDIITFSYRFIDLGRLDIISITTIMFISLLQLSLYCYALLQCFMKVFSRLSKTYSVVVFDIVFLSIVVSSMLNYLVAIELGKNVMVYFAILLQIFFPVLLLVPFGKRKVKK